MEKILEWLKLAGVEQSGDETQFKLWKKLLLEEYQETVDAFEDNNIEEQVDGIADIIWIAFNWAHMKNLPIIETLKKVEISNYSKFCKSKEEAIETVYAYENGVHWDKQGVKIDCYFKQVGDYFIVKKTEDNKILKSINYTPVKNVKLN
jgi:phosphoribosyl-ATP pyrophosphohydrolase